jgi:NAD(P)-dependent dehydrogenase (short-subunit alcohol dehydrogenase family)
MILLGRAYDPPMQTIVLVGATGDLGRGVVPRLARDYRCVVVYRTADSFERLKRDCGDVPLTGVDSLDRIAELAPVHALVHLAGGFASGSGAADFAKMLESNLLPAVQAIEAVVPHLAPRGRIVAISSASSQTKPAGLAAYNASKAALNATIETLAKDLKTRGIRVNALLPTTLDTPANRATMKPEQLVPLERIADTIAFLLSDAAQQVNGQLITLSA